MSRVKLSLIAVFTVIFLLTAAGCDAAPSKAESMFKGQLAPEMAHAISEGDIDTMKQLIAEGADVNAVDQYNRTLLVWALIKNKPEAFELLLEKGVDPTIHIEGAGMTVIHGAAETGTHPEFLRMLLKYGAPVDIENGGGATPLFYAMGNPETVQILINHGADINHQNTVGGTPLHAAAAAGDYIDVIRLLKLGANHFIINKQGVTFQGYLDTDMPDKLYTDHALKMRDKIRAYLREHDIPVRF